MRNASLATANFFLFILFESTLFFDGFSFNDNNPGLTSLSHKDGKDGVVKEVYPGDSVHSLLSILDVITVSHTHNSILFVLMLFNSTGNPITLDNVTQPLFASYYLFLFPVPIPFPVLVPVFCSLSCSCFFHFFFPFLRNRPIMFVKTLTGNDIFWILCIIHRFERLCISGSPETL